MNRHPIPRLLLPHRATLLTVETDAWQNPVEKDACELQHIRIDAELTRSADAKDTSHAARWVLFFDCTNSLPRGASFSPGQVVVWNGMRLTVNRVLPVYADRTLHHYELEMEGG